MPENVIPAVPAVGEEPGYLIAIVRTAGGFFPLEGADVRISGAEEANREIFFLITSDQSGMTAKIALPAPPISLSRSPGNPPGYLRYNLQVFKEGFYVNTFLNLPIFPTVTSVQRIDMIPHPEYDPAGNRPIDELLIVNQEPSILSEERNA